MGYVFIKVSMSICFLEYYILNLCMEMRCQLVRFVSMRQLTTQFD